METLEERFPFLFNKQADYNTNSPSYYDGLAKYNKVLQILAKMIEEYDEKLDNSLENINTVLTNYTTMLDGKLAGFDDSVMLLLREWIDDGTFEMIINTEIFNHKLDTATFTEYKENADSVALSFSEQLAQIGTADTYGALGDNSADDTQSLINLFSSGKPIIILGKNKNYKVSDALFLPDDVTIYFNGSKINMYLDGNKSAFVVGSRNKIYDFNVELFSSNSDGMTQSAQWQTPLTIGNVIDETVSIRDVYMNGVTVRGNRPGGKLIAILGDTKNIIIENVTIPDNQHCIIPIVIHWGNTDGFTVSGTGHPSNIIIRNVKGGKMTALVPESSAIFLSAVHNILLENIAFESVPGEGITVYSGDVGYQYANAEDKHNAMKNIVVRNASFKSGRHSFKAILSGGLAEEVHSPTVLLENIHGESIEKAQANSSGVYVENVPLGGLTIRHADIANHHHGIAFGSNVRHVVIENSKFYRNYRSGAYVDYPGANPPEDIVFRECDFLLNGSGDIGSHRSGIFANRTNRVVVDHCRFGDRENEVYQQTGVRLTGEAKNSKIMNNHVFNTIEGGFGYILGTGVDVGIVDSFYNNTANGVPLKTGSSDVPLVIRQDGTKFNAPLSKYGTKAVSGDGTTTLFNIPHGLGVKPLFFTAQANNGVASTAEVIQVSATATDVVVIFKNAPTVGTENTSINWKVEM